MGGGGAWPGFETTRRATLAARTARGRAAAHGSTKQPGRNNIAKAAAPVTGRYTRSEGVHCLRIGCSASSHKNKRGICETTADTHKAPGTRAPGPQLSRSSANTPRRAVAAICDGDAGDGQPIA